MFCWGYKKSWQYWKTNCAKNALKKLQQKISWLVQSKTSKRWSNACLALAMTWIAASAFIKPCNPSVTPFWRFSVPK
jgi:hypothetical protein